MPGTRARATNCSSASTSRMKFRVGAAAVLNGLLVRVKPAAETRAQRVARGCPRTRPQRQVHTFTDAGLEHHSQ